MTGKKLTRTLATILRTGILLLLACASVGFAATDLIAMSCEECHDDHCNESDENSCACLHAHFTINTLPALSAEWSYEPTSPSSAPQPIAQDAEQEWFDAIDHPPQILH